VPTDVVDVFEEIEEDVKKQVRLLRDHSVIMRSRIEAQSVQLDGMELKHAGMRAENKAIKQELDLYTRALERLLLQNLVLVEAKSAAEERAVRAEQLVEKQAEEIAQLKARLSGGPT